MRDKGDTSHTTEVVVIAGIGLSSQVGFWALDFVLRGLYFAFFTFAVEQRPFCTLARDEGTSALLIKKSSMKSQKKLCNV
jgi:hypothetical protein